MRKNQGITLVALIITIIIMLVLVAVSVNVIVKSNLIGTAEKAANGYKTAYERENDGSIIINGKTYGSLDEYMEEINPTIVEGDIEEWEFDSEDDGTVALKLYKGRDTKVVFPNYVNKKPVKTIKQTRKATVIHGNIVDTNIWAAELCDPDTYLTSQKTITEIDISYGIQNIGDNTFSSTGALETVNMPSSVIQIGDNAFSYCKALTEITIPSSVTTMGSSVFSGIPSITVHVPWKENENKPEGWADDWNATVKDCTVTVVYAE